MIAVMERRKEEKGRRGWKDGKKDGKIREGKRVRRRDRVLGR